MTTVRVPIGLSPMRPLVGGIIPRTPRISLRGGLPVGTKWRRSAGRAETEFPGSNRLSNLTDDTAMTSAQYDDGRRRPRHLLPLVIAGIGEGGYFWAGVVAFASHFCSSVARAQAKFSSWMITKPFAIQFSQVVESRPHVHYRSRVRPHSSRL
jgi:hypothetical protein